MLDNADSVKMTNAELADVLRRIASLKEQLGEESFKVRAYRTAAINVVKNPVQLRSMPRLPKIKGVGESIGKLLKELLADRRCPLLLQLEEQVQALEVETGRLEYADLLKVPGIGHKKAAKLSEAGINNRDDLFTLLESGKLKDDDGSLRRAIRFSWREVKRVRREVALEATQSLFTSLAGLNAVDKIEFGGSMRRKSTTVGDVDILVCTSFSSIVIDAFSKMVPRDSVISKGDTKCSIFLEVPMVTCGCDGSDDVVSLRVDLLCVPEKSWGAALNYFTGSVSHNVELRALAKSKGLRVNEFGIFRRSDGKRVGGSDERDLYNLLGIAYVAPEDRS